MTRESDCTPDRIARIAEGIGLGLTKVLAAKYGGISKTTYYRWLERAKQGEAPFTDFEAAIQDAEAQNAARCMSVIMKAARSGTWQAAAWTMERRHGYSARQDVRLDARVEGAGLTDDDVVAELGMMLEDADAK